MQKIIIFLTIGILFCGVINLNAGFEILNTNELGVTYSQHYINELADKKDAETSILEAKQIIKEINEIVKNYSTLTLDQKISIMRLVSKGIKKSISHPQIGSGNILIFSLLCDLYQLLLTDLAKDYHINDKVKNEINLFIEQPFNEINTEQISNLLLNEFHTNPPMGITNTNQLLLNIIGCKYSASDNRSLFDQLMTLLNSNKGRSWLNVQDQLNNPDPKVIFQMYILSEIKISFIKCGMKLKFYQPSKMNLEDKYLFYKTTMNQLQKEIFNFTEPKFDRNSRVIYDILAMENHAKWVSKTDSNIMLNYLKIRLEMNPK